MNVQMFSTIRNVPVLLTQHHIATCQELNKAHLYPVQTFVKSEGENNPV